MEIAVYAENHSRAGEICRDEEKIERRSDDLVFFEGTPEKLRADAEMFQRHAKTQWMAQAARNVLEEVELYV